MKKNLFLLFICIFLVSFQPSTFQDTTMSSNKKSEVSFFPDTEMSLTLKEAIEIAQKEALKWNKEAMLYGGNSVDKDNTPTGMEGKRKHWNIEFGIPGKTDFYLVTIRDGKANEKAHVPAGLEVMPKSYFIASVDEFKFDTPELLKKGQKNTKIPR
ncbi:hypothetical protein ACQKNX_03310 [Lysinibacillus sp. NPDC093712]|uniref:hypothetical protein n=1 Tax=Lysinibacillus sp. NPDC093712 TaxID=3390579 RepID=UPI003D0922D7